MTDYNEPKVEIIFEKDSYIAGDQVIAKFKLTGPFHSSLKRIILTLESGEQIKVKYKTKARIGEPSTLSILSGEKIPYSETIFYERKERIIENFQFDLIEEELSFVLPYAIPMKSNDVTVFHRAVINYENGLLIREEFKSEIPYEIYFPNLERQQLTATKEDLSIVVDKNIASPRDSIKVAISSTSDTPEDYKKIKIELEQDIWKIAEGQSSHIKKKYLLGERLSINDFPEDFMIIPPIENLPSNKGFNFEIKYRLNFILSKSLWQRSTKISTGHSFYYFPFYPINTDKIIDSNRRTQVDQEIESFNEKSIKGRINALELAIQSISNVTGIWMACIILPIIIGGFIFPVYAIVSIFFGTLGIVPIPTEYNPVFYIEIIIFGTGFGTFGLVFFIYTNPFVDKMKYKARLRNYIEK